MLCAIKEIVSVINFTNEECTSDRQTHVNSRLIISTTALVLHLNNFDSRQAGHRAFTVIFIILLILGGLFSGEDLESNMPNFEVVALVSLAGIGVGMFVTSGESLHSMFVTTISH